MHEDITKDVMQEAHHVVLYLQPIFHQIQIH